MATRPKIFLDKKEITKLIKEVFEEEFIKQEINITKKIVSINFTLPVKEIKILKQEVNDLKESTESKMTLNKKLLIRKKNLHF